MKMKLEIICTINIDVIIFRETPCVAILNKQKCLFFLFLQNQRTGGHNRSCVGVVGIIGREEDVGKGSRRVNIVQILCTHICKCKNEKNEKGDTGEWWRGVKSSIKCLLYCKKFCKCHNVYQHNKKKKKKGNVYSLNPVFER
jgi:hypothetical protein